MRVSIQRQCDGDPNVDRCDARLEINVIAADTRGDVEAFAKVWQAAAVELGWRRLNGPGESFAVFLPTQGALDKLELREGPPQHGDIVIPDYKTWLLCPACLEKHVYVCARCGFELCSCMGGPRFDVLRAGDDHE